MNTPTTRPKCWNRPPVEKGRTRFVLDQDTGKTIPIELRNDWFEDRCVAWDGTGIGAPTQDYPTGTPYPIAHGFDCIGCRWFPGTVETVVVDPAPLALDDFP